MSDDRNSHLSTASVILPLYYLMSPEKFSTLTAQEDPDYVVTLNTTQVTPQVWSLTALKLAQALLLGWCFQN